jgi:hypothetical protein
MLQHGMLPASLAGLLWVFRSCFTGPSFRTFSVLAAGMVAQPGRRTVVGMLTGAGLAGVWHHSRAHWFFARARWSPRDLSAALVGLIVDRLVPVGAPVVVAVDDTLFRRSGRRVHGAGWHHDAAVKTRRDARVSWGNCWVVAGIVVDLPVLRRPVCLPVAAALCTASGRATRAAKSPAQASKQVLACELVTRIAAGCRGRSVHVVADAWYAGADGAAGAGRGQARQRGLPEGVSLTSRLRVNAALSAIAAPVPGAAGRPRRIGARLGSPGDLAAVSSWTTARVRRYGHDAMVDVAEHTVLWYGVYRSRAVRVVLLREPGSTAKNGYDLALITTDMTSSPAQLVERYATRWSIEVAFEDAKQLTGVGQAHNRTRAAVTRTVPFGLFVQSLVVVWYVLHAHHHDDVAQRRREAPWYRSKTEPAYQDMIVKLRRTLIVARFLEGNPRQPTPEETLTVQQAWAEAAA